MKKAWGGVILAVRSALSLPWWVVLLLLAVAALAGFAGHRQPWLLRQGELLLYDVNAQAIARTPTQRMALVVVGERSLATIGAWPFPRRRHAELLGRLSQARVVGMDFLFPEPAARPEDDLAFARAMSAHGRVVLAAHTAPYTDGPDAGQFPVLPTPVLYDAAADIGFTNVDKDVGGLIRFARPIRTAGRDMLPSLALALARQAQQDEESVSMEGSALYLRFRTHSVQMDSDARLWFVPTAQGPPSFEYVDVLHGRVPPDVFKDAIVLVGAAASGAADFQVVPKAFGSRVISGVRFNAEELRALLSGDAIRVQPPLVNAVVSAVLALVCGLAMFMCKPLRGGLIAAGACLLWLACGWLLLARQLVWVAGLTPVAGAAVAGTLMLLARLAAMHESWHAQFISLDSIVYLNESEARVHPSLNSYLQALWSRVEAGTGISFQGGPMRLEELPGDFAAAADQEGVLIKGAGKGVRQMAVPLRSGADMGYALFGLGRRTSDDSARAAAALAISAAWFFSVQQEGQRRRRMLTDTIKAVFTALDYRDPITGGHSTRVAEMCLRIMDRMDLPPRLYEDIHLGALIHDLGKIGIPDNILNKRESLNAEEYSTIRNHPNIARSILNSVELPSTALEAVFHHHERYDGTGYPQGLRGEEISLGGRIVAIADAFDAMSHSRPYRQGQTLDEVLKRMSLSEGDQFDPVILRVFMDLFAAEKAAQERQGETRHEDS